jgi:hypothetical protein
MDHARARAARDAVLTAERDLQTAERTLAAARAALDDARAAAVAERFRTVHWEVLYELRIGGMLVRYDDPSPSNNNDRNLPRRYREKPGCLVSGEFDRRTPVSDRTMRMLVDSGLAHWTRDQGGPVEMRLTPAGERRMAGHLRPSLERKAA